MDFESAKRSPGMLLPITEEQFEYMLGVLPPVYGHMCFAMGEPYSRTPNGTPVYYWAGKCAGRCYIFLGTKVMAEEMFWLGKVMANGLAYRKGSWPAPTPDVETWKAWEEVCWLDGSGNEITIYVPLVSLDGGETWVTPAEACASVPWEVISLALDKGGFDNHVLNHPDKAQYLERLLRSKEKDLVIE